MSGVEVLGIVASTIQLADYALRISNTLLEILERLQEYPARLHSYVDQVSYLIETARLVEVTPSLQTPTIHAHIRKTLAAAIELQTTLERLASDYSQKSRTHRYFQIILKGAFEEKQLTAKFGSLERQKSDLIFSISVVHSDALADIQGKVTLLVDIVNCQMGLGMPLLFAQKKKPKKEKTCNSSLPQDEDRTALAIIEDIRPVGDGSQTSASEPEPRPTTSARMSCDTKNQGDTNADPSISDNVISKSQGLMAIFGSANKKHYHMKGNKKTDGSKGFIGVCGDNKTTRAMVDGIFKN